MKVKAGISSSDTAETHSAFIAEIFTGKTALSDLLIFRYLNERGVKVSEIFSVLRADVKSKEALKQALVASLPSRKSVIEQVFSRY